MLANSKKLQHQEITDSKTTTCSITKSGNSENQQAAHTPQQTKQLQGSQNSKSSLKRGRLPTQDELSFQKFLSQNLQVSQYAKSVDKPQNEPQTTQTQFFVQPQQQANPKEK